MIAGGVLSLDLATASGWAYATPEAVDAWARTPLEAHGRRQDGLFYGTHRLPKAGEDVGWFLDALDCWLVEMTEVYRPYLVAFEAPYISSKTSQEAAYKLLNLAGHTEFFCRRARLQYRRLMAQDVRKHFMGRGSGPRELMKRMVMEACAQRGWTPADDNQADALACCDYAIACILAGRRRAA